MVTRSGKSGQQLVELLKVAGVTSYFIPTLKIQKEALIISAEDFQQAIFVSRNAVKYSLETEQLLKDFLPSQLIAVGSGTAARLEENGYKEVLVPTISNSEGLLALSQLHNVKGQHILIVKGVGGRELLEEKLSERGAICHPLEAYSRVENEIDESLWQDFLKTKPLSIVTLASGDALTALNRKLHGSKLKQSLTLVVASQRIAELATTKGFKQVVVVHSASNEAMYKAIISLVNKNPVD